LLALCSSDLRSPHAHPPLSNEQRNEQRTNFAIRHFYLAVTASYNQPVAALQYS
jgi:hypothetical protein